MILFSHLFQHVHVHSEHPLHFIEHVQGCLTSRLKLSSSDLMHFFDHIVGGLGTLFKFLSSDRLWLHWFRCTSAPGFVLHSVALGCNTGLQRLFAGLVSEDALAAGFVVLPVFTLVPVVLEGHRFRDV